MNETLVTLQGWLGSDVDPSATPATALVAGFRVACTPRRYQKKTDEWVDGDTQWYSVSAWRALAQHVRAVAAPRRPGRRPRQAQCPGVDNSAGIEVTSFEVEAMFVGHDLNRGTSQFTATRPTGRRR